MNESQKVVSPAEPPSKEKVKELIEKIEAKLGKTFDWFERSWISSKVSANKAEKQHIYAFELENGTVKIGIAKNVKDRAIGIFSGSGLKILNIYHTAPCAYASKIESACHETFAEYRTNGEFFKISFADACAELDRHAEDIVAFNQAAEEEYQRKVQTAWDNFEELEENYFGEMKNFPSPSVIPSTQFSSREKVRLLMQLIDKTEDNNLRDDLIKQAAFVLNQN